MKLFVFAGAMLALFAPAAAAQPVAAPGDSAAIMAAIDHWERAWESHDARLASADYSDDADWTNALGCAGSAATASRRC